jgi:hypothetical protein
LSLVDSADVELSIVAQCRLLKVAHSTLYRPPGSGELGRPTADAPDQRAVSGDTYYGGRRMVAVFRRQSWTVNRKRMRRLMRTIRIEAIYQDPVRKLAQVPPMNAPGDVTLLAWRTVVVVERLVDEGRNQAELRFDVLRVMPRDRADPKLKLPTQLLEQCHFGVPVHERHSNPIAMIVGSGTGVDQKWSALLGQNSVALPHACGPGCHWLSD